MCARLCRRVHSVLASRRVPAAAAAASASTASLSSLSSLAAAAAPAAGSAAAAAGPIEFLCRFEGSSYRKMEWLPLGVMQARPIKKKCVKPLRHLATSSTQSSKWSILIGRVGRRSTKSYDVALSLTKCLSGFTQFVISHPSQRGEVVWATPLLAARLLPRSLFDTELCALFGTKELHWIDNGAHVPFDTKQLRLVPLFPSNGIRLSLFPSSFIRLLSDLNYGRRSWGSCAVTGSATTPPPPTPRQGGC